MGGLSGGLLVVGGASLVDYWEWEVHLLRIIGNGRHVMRIIGSVRRLLCILFDVGGIS